MKTITLNPVNLNQGQQVCLAVKPDYTGDTLNQFLSKVTKQSFEHWTRKGTFFKEKHQLEGRSVVSAGEQITFKRAPWKEPPVPREVQLVYHDPFISIIEKPAGLPVLPSGDFFQNSLIHLVKRVDELDQRVPAHRLDLETSGLLILAKQGEALKQVQAMFRNRKITKTYQTMVWGKPESSLLALKGNLGKLKGSAIHSKWGYVEKGGKPCETRILHCRHYKDVSFLELQPVSGRTNQIRAQLKEAGYPIIGDKKYYFDESIYLDWIDYRDFQRIQGQMLLPFHALHASQLCFIHPFSGKELTITSPFKAEASWLNQIDCQ